MRVLITGFGPFPGAPSNPTAALVERLGRSRRFGSRIERFTHVFPVRYATFDAQLHELLRRIEPDVVLMFGLALRRKQLSIETRARNAASLLHADAAGGKRSLSLIAAQAPSCVPGRSPFAQVAVAARRFGQKAALSRDAGRYLCNYAYWRALEATAQRPRAPLVVFVHVPKLRPAGSIRRGKPRPPTIADLVRSGEAILNCLIAAARHRH